MPPVCIFFSLTVFVFAMAVLGCPALATPPLPAILHCCPALWMLEAGCRGRAVRRWRVLWSRVSHGRLAHAGAGQWRAPPGPLSSSSQPRRLLFSPHGPHPNFLIVLRVSIRHLLTLPPCKDSRPAPRRPLRHGDRSRQTLAPPRALRSARRIVDMEHTRCQRHLGQRNREPQQT